MIPVFDTPPATMENHPWLEYLASADGALVASEYVTGVLWSGGPDALRRVAIEGRFCSVGGDGRQWAALAPDRARIIVSDGDRIREGGVLLAATATAVAASARGVWVALPDRVVRLDDAWEPAETRPLPGAVVLSADATGERLAAACPEEHRVVVLSEGGACVELDRVAGRPLRAPRGISFDASGALWISDTENRRIVRVDGLRSVDLGHRPGFPVGITHDRGTLWLASPYERLLATAEDAVTGAPRSRSLFYPFAVARFNGGLWTSHPAGSCVLSHADGRRLDDFADPIALLPWNGRLVVAERDRNRLVLLGSCGERHPVAMPGDAQPRALTESDEGDLWVVTQFPHALVRYTRGGTPERVASLEMYGPPRAIAWDRGAPLVAAMGVAACLRLDPVTGALVERIDLRESPVSLATHPGGGALAGLDRLGTILRIVEGRTCTIASGLVTPRGILVESNRLIVAESLSHRLTVLGVDGATHDVE